MTTATKPYHGRIAVVFDFDLTLAPDSFNALLARCGVDDPIHWREEHIQPLAQSGWDTILARIYGLVRLSSAGTGPRITTTGQGARRGMLYLWWNRTSSRSRRAARGTSS